MTSRQIPAMPPPPGMHSNFVDPPDQLNQNIAFHTVCLTVVTLSVAVRLYTRMRITKASLGMDDYFCVLSYALSVAFSGLMIKTYTLGIGRHMWDTPLTWFLEARKFFVFAEWVYIALTCVIKLTFLFFYYRIFSSQTITRYAIYFGFFFVVCSHIPLFFATIFHCSPVARSWDPTLKGYCKSKYALPYTSGILSSATDLYILLLPMQSLWSLSLKVDRKLKLMGIFGLGIFACAASLIRLGKTPAYYSNKDATRGISDMAIWAVIEINVGILCASATLLPAFFDRHWPKAINSSIVRFWAHTRSRKSSSATLTKIESPPSDAASGQSDVHVWAANASAESGADSGFPKALHGTNASKDFDDEKSFTRY
ncbi:hypothetical protein EJ04DRAFT_599748 [Polyplosphaeria fusca]|uniref:Rhodopsin domain-containing protein n=1 Tax=Polyplosphaeria fusca TaxID=682080 RepID=A0A9P4V2I6_9PLEO|nr:hypothetical protein EJ04DRAFT_599748 [Polyplosphaeria fusca]